MFVSSVFWYLCCVWVWYSFFIFSLFTLRQIEGRVIAERNNPYDIFYTLVQVHRITLNSQTVFCVPRVCVSPTKEKILKAGVFLYLDRWVYLKFSSLIIACKNQNFVHLLMLNLRAWKRKIWQGESDCRRERERKKKKRLTLDGGVCHRLNNPIFLFINFINKITMLFFFFTWNIWWFLIKCFGVFTRLEGGGKNIFFITNFLFRVSAILRPWSLFHFGGHINNYLIFTCLYFV